MPGCRRQRRRTAADRWTGAEGRRWRERRTWHRSRAGPTRCSFDDFQGSRDGAVGYAFRKSRAPKPGRRCCRPAATIAMRIWVNGKLVFAQDGARVTHERRRPVEVDLVAGDNARAGESWPPTNSFSLRVLETGTVLRGPRRSARPSRASCPPAFSLNTDVNSQARRCAARESGSDRAGRRGDVHGDGARAANSCSSMARPGPTVPTKSAAARRTRRACSTSRISPGTRATRSPRRASSRPKPRRPTRRSPKASRSRCSPTWWRTGSA